MSEVECHPENLYIVKATSSGVIHLLKRLKGLVKVTDKVASISTPSDGAEGQITTALSVTASTTIASISTSTHVNASISSSLETVIDQVQTKKRVISIKSRSRNSSQQPAIVNGIPVFAQFLGTIEKLYVQSGDIVEAGCPVMAIAPCKHPGNPTLEPKPGINLTQT